MVTRFGRVLRLAFDRNHSTTEAPATPASDSNEVDFSAFAEDCRLYGRLRMDADRLTDMLNDHDEILLLDVRIEALADGTVHEVAEFTVKRDEILVVEAVDARGDPTRRTHTQPTPIVAQLGPYEVHGFVHLKPGTDALDALHRRKAMVPLTDASISYIVNGISTYRRAATVIFNRELVDQVTVIDAKVNVDGSPMAEGQGAAAAAAEGQPAKGQPAKGQPAAEAQAAAKAQAASNGKATKAVRMPKAG